MDRKGAVRMGCARALAAVTEDGHTRFRLVTSVTVTETPEILKKLKGYGDGDKAKALDEWAATMNLWRP